MVSHHSEYSESLLTSCLLKYGQRLTGLLQSMNNSGMRTCFSSGFIVITVVSSAKDMILSRSEQIVVYFDVSH